jgi:hypothetical protein
MVGTEVIVMIDICCDFAMAMAMEVEYNVSVMGPQQGASAVTGTGRSHHLEDRGDLVGAQ